MTAVGRSARAARWFVPGLLSIVVLGLLLRLAFSVWMAVPIGIFPGDERYYQHVGLHIAEGDGYVYDAIGPLRPDADHPPLFTLLYAGFYSVGIDDDPKQRVALSFIVVSAIAMVGLAGRRAGGPTVGLVAAGIAAVHPNWIQMGPNLWPEGIFVVAVSGAVLLACRYLSRPSLRLALGLGVVVGLAGLTRTEGLFLAPLLALPLTAVVRPEGTPRWRPVAIAAAGVALTVSPWLARNYAEFGVVAMSSQEGAALVGANCSTTYDGDALGGYDFNCWITANLAEEMQTRKDLTPMEENKALRARAITYISNHKAELPKVMSARVLRGWGLYASGHELSYIVIQHRHEGLQNAGQWVHWTLLPFGVAGAVLLWRRRRPMALVLLSGPVAFTLFSALFTGSMRYRALAEPALAIFCAIGLVALWSRLRPPTETTAFEATTPRAVAETGSEPA